MIHGSKVYVYSVYIYKIYSLFIIDLLLNVGYNEQLLCIIERNVKKVSLTSCFGCQFSYSMIRFHLYRIFSVHGQNTLSNIVDCGVGNMC